MEKLHIFSWQVFNMNIDSSLMRFFGPRYDHHIVKILHDEIEKLGFTCEVYSSKIKVWRYVPLEDLYDYDSKLWLVN